MASNRNPDELKRAFEQLQETFIKQLLCLNPKHKDYVSNDIKNLEQLKNYVKIEVANPKVRALMEIDNPAAFISQASGFLKNKVKDTNSDNVAALSDFFTKVESAAKASRFGSIDKTITRNFDSKSSNASLLEESTLNLIRTLGEVAKIANETKKQMKMETIVAAKPPVPPPPASAGLARRGESFTTPQQMEAFNRSSTNQSPYGVLPSFNEKGEIQPDFKPSGTSAPAPPSTIPSVYANITLVIQKAQLADIFEKRGVDRSVATEFVGKLSEQLIGQLATLNNIFKERKVDESVATEFIDKLSSQPAEKVDAMFKSLTDPKNKLYNDKDFLGGVLQANIAKFEKAEQKQVDSPRMTT